jgi:lipopolysaccharide export system protein LptC
MARISGTGRFGREGMNISQARTATSGLRPATVGARDKRVERAFAQARRHSGRVRLLKLALPAAALLMIVGFVGKSWLSAPTGLPIDLRALAIEDGRLVMTDPKIDGLTGADNRPYSMTATRAVQDIGMSGRIDLEGIDARLPLDDKGWMTVAAPSGVFDRGANRLDIDSELTVESEDGMKALFKSARIDIATGSLETSDPVDISLDGAHITADSMSVRDKGAVLIFENRVRMQIDGGRLRGAAAGEEAQ